VALGYEVKDLLFSAAQVGDAASATLRVEEYLVQVWSQQLEDETIPLVEVMARPP
jgi:hypothetical protein